MQVLYYYSSSVSASYINVTNEVGTNIQSLFGITNLLTVTGSYGEPSIYQVYSGSMLIVAYPASQTTLYYTSSFFTNPPTTPYSILEPTPPTSSLLGSAALTWTLNASNVVSSYSGSYVTIYNNTTMTASVSQSQGSPAGNSVSLIAGNSHTLTVYGGGNSYTSSVALYSNNNDGTLNLISQSTNINQSSSILFTPQVPQTYTAYFGVRDTTPLVYWTYNITGDDGFISSSYFTLKDNLSNTLATNSGSTNYNNSAGVALSAAGRIVSYSLQNSSKIYPFSSSYSYSTAPLSINGTGFYSGSSSGSLFTTSQSSKYYVTLNMSQSYLVAPTNYYCYFTSSYTPYLLSSSYFGFIEEESQKTVLLITGNNGNLQTGSLGLTVGTSYLMLMYNTYFNSLTGSLTLYNTRTNTYLTSQSVADALGAYSYTFTPQQGDNYIVTSSFQASV